MIHYHQYMVFYTPILFLGAFLIHRPEVRQFSLSCLIIGGICFLLDLIWRTKKIRERSKDQ